MSTLVSELTVQLWAVSPAGEVLVAEITGNAPLWNYVLSQAIAIDQAHLSKATGADIPEEGE